jgi:hypothetical protein
MMSAIWDSGVVSVAAACLDLDYDGGEDRWDGLFSVTWLLTTVCTACPSAGIITLQLPKRLLSVAMKLAEKMEEDEELTEQFSPHLAALLDCCQALGDAHPATSEMWLDSHGKELLRLCMMEPREVVHPAFCLLRSLVNKEANFSAAPLAVKDVLAADEIPTGVWHMPEQLAVDYAVQCCDKLVNSTDKPIASIACQMLLQMVKFRPMVIADLGALEFVGAAIQEKWRGSNFAQDIRKLTMLFADGPEEAVNIAVKVRMELVSGKAQALIHGFVVRRRWKKIKHAIKVLQRMIKERRLNFLFGVVQTAARDHIDRHSLDARRTQRVAHKASRRKEMEKVDAADLSMFMMERTTHAAATVQRWWRGVRVRRSIAAEKAAAADRLLVEKNAAATVLQKYTRGYLSRKTQNVFAMLMLPIHREIPDARRIELQRQIDLRREMTKKTDLKHEVIEKVHVQAHELLRAHGRRRAAAALATQKRTLLVQDLARYAGMFDSAPRLDAGTAEAAEKFKQTSASIRHQATAEHRRDLKLSRQAFWQPLVTANETDPTIQELLFSQEKAGHVGIPCKLWLRRLYDLHHGDSDAVWSAINLAMPFEELYASNNKSVEVALAAGLKTRQAQGQSPGDAPPPSMWDDGTKLDVMREIQELASVKAHPEDVIRFIPQPGAFQQQQEVAVN